MKTMSPRLVLGTFAIFAMAAVTTAFADCVHSMRAATAQEKQSYADAVALFERLVPPAPEGWTSQGGTTDKALNEVCAAPGEMVATWSFYRGYERQLTVRDKAALDQNVSAALARSDATKSANRSKLAENQKKIDATQKKMQELIAAGKAAEVQPLVDDLEKLMNEQARLQGTDQMSEDSAAAGSQFARDTSAQFALTVNQATPNTSGFSSYAVPAGKGYRKVANDINGNPRATILIALPPTPGQRGQTVVRVEGDPSRADALVKATKFR